MNHHKNILEPPQIVVYREDFTEVVSQLVSYITDQHNVVYWLK